ncbi:alpha/beta hydrolase [Lysobacter auxotrophicus]|uniref:Alpha/beta-hydrolase family protein n=1 Tax=Lysobacter auxotrophicus TaxID=2992573 RepID=A0ABM8DDR0_9GAMM|nr:alpha/beta-hydrolase family protein [Lysobacter auxotrophicus]BDU16733.1 alpha/beta-hydrolase family protein [Lysobacter auxotrophicus]
MREEMADRNGIAVATRKRAAAFARIRAPLSPAGLILGALFLVASLTPSLIPRTPTMQGVLAGVAFGAGYAIGVFLRWLWETFELPPSRGRTPKRVKHALYWMCALIVLWAFWRAPHWQNHVRAALRMAPEEGADSFTVAAVALLAFAALLALARVLRGMAVVFSLSLAKVLPPRVASVLGVSAVLVVVIVLSNSIVLRIALQVIDSSFRQADALIPPDTAPPREAYRTGSPASLIAWENLGRMGRRFVSSAPGAHQIASLAGEPAQTPLRVYAGLPSGESAQARAQLALAELKRVGGFSRGALVIVTPTGTGWVDPAGIESIEYLRRGDVASVAMQYSYLSSPLSLMIEPEYGEESSQALFEAVYGYWRTLPHDARPRLYLHGLSLGAMNSERSLELVDVLGDPPQGALWSGPPFAARQWRRMTLMRNPGSPAWLPTFRDGRFVRFMNQHGSPVPADAPWGPMRVIYLQYASDAITFFDHRDVFSAPAWLHPRGPDVAPQMRWYPVVSTMQLVLDMMLADDAPMGFGHVFAPSHYVAAWRQVAGIQDWSAPDIARLSRTLDARRAAQIAGDEDEGGG